MSEFAESPRRRPRARTTRVRVRVTEQVVRVLITVGGIGTIAAVALIVAFLLWVVAPLFTGAALAPARRAVLSGDGSNSAVARFQVDEYGLLGAVLREDGVLQAVDLATGAVLDERRPFGSEVGAPPTALSFSGNGADSHFAAGFADGSIRAGTLGFRTRFPTAEELPAEVTSLSPGEHAAWGRGVVQVTPEGRFRFQETYVTFEEPIRLKEPAAVVSLGHARSGDTTVFCAWLADDRIVHLEARERENFLTAEVEQEVEQTLLHTAVEPERGPPAEIVVEGLGDSVLLIWENGRLERLDVRDPRRAKVAEIVDVVPAEEGRLTAAGLLVGGTTLVVGDSTGRVAAWFRIKPEDAGTSDGSVLVPAHVLVESAPPVTCLAPSARSRLLATGHADGSVRLFHVTTEALLGASPGSGSGRGLRALRLNAKEDTLVGLTPGGVARWEIDARHPEASLPALFAPVWYEGYEKPAHVWQSTGGTDDFEPKLGFLPLVFGTLKATFYTMLFGAPLALLAAVFTSEFLARRLRTSVKSTIEMMASLPSVVLGFFAALVIAPFVQSVVPATMAVLVTLPLALLGGAYLWQLLPARVSLRAGGWGKIAGMGLALPVGVGGGILLGPVVERFVFAGDAAMWLDGQRGDATGGWALLLLPPAAFLVVFLGARLTGPWFRARSRSWSRDRCARIDILRFLLGGAVSMGLALAAAWTLDAAGFDPRHGLVGTYVQRNALIVGFVMGFAVIPVIYTLAEDALSSVPDHLRLASLGAGATPWQTAVRVVIPTATSGLFTAVMIGLGRAVGETMIVLMATGNTPIMDANVFNGFRTLSANIAVELPEAVRNSTHYRTLFLAALVLFAMTFVLNTAAELVRLRFRRRTGRL